MFKQPFCVTLKEGGEEGRGGGKGRGRRGEGGIRDREGRYMKNCILQSHSKKPCPTQWIVHQCEFAADKSSECLLPPSQYG